MQKSFRKVLATYDNFAAFYDLMNGLYFFGRDKRFRSILVKKANLKTGDTVLDLCCGTGLNFPFILEKIGIQGTLVGVDVSSKMLRHSIERRLNGNVCLIRSDSAHLPLRNKSQDIILASFCLRITPTLDNVLDEIVRVLKSDGRLGVLANSSPTGTLKILGNMVTKLISLVNKVNFKINLNDYLFRKFKILEVKKMHSGLVELLVGTSENGNK